jgi:hypothetical protein
VEAAGLAGMISILDTIIRTAMIILTGNLFAAPGLVMLVKEYDPQNAVHSLLALVNALTFWVLAVRSLALARLASISFLKAAIWVFGIWVAYTGLLMGIGFGIRALTGQ